MEIDSILKEKIWPPFEALAFQLKEQRLADITASAPQPLRTRGLPDGLFVVTLPPADDRPLTTPPLPRPAGRGAHAAQGKLISRVRKG